MLQWQCRTDLARHAKIAEIEKMNGDVVDAQLDTRFPCSEIGTESTVGVNLQSCVQSWAETVGVPTPSVAKSTEWTFTTPGYHFDHSAMAT